MTSQEIKLIAHGGFSTKFEENTLVSYLAAAEFQPYAIEMDVIQHPQTGELICFHPSGVSSASGTYSPEAIREQLKQNEQPPKLADVVRQIPGKSKFLIDFKQPAEDVFRKLLEDTEIDLSRIIIGVRNIEFFKFIKEINPDVELLALFSNPDDYKVFAQEGGKFFRLWEKDLEHNRIQAIQALGLEVWVTPGQKATETQKRTAGEVDEDKLDWLMGLMVNAVLVNDIEFAVEYLESFLPT